VLLQDPNTVAFVGSPNVFVSHAWSYKFVDVVQALCEFADRQPEPVFFWFDCLCIDEHATQVLGPDFWDTTFKASIAAIGHTVMVLSPWQKPIPLTRSWCLWEIFCTIDVGARFTVCLPNKEKKAFQEALRDDHEAFLHAVADIDVAEAEAGNPTDKQRILDAVQATAEGTSGVNAMAKGQMREWMLGDVVPEMLAKAREDEDLGGVMSAGLVMQTFGEREEARRLYDEVIAGFTESLGASHTDTLNAKMGLANLLKQLGEA